MDLLTRATLGFLVVSIFGVISYKKGFVDVSGLAMGFIVGFTVLVFPEDGWKLFILLLTFHLSAGFFTKFKYNYKQQLGSAEWKRGARGWMNVMANGGIPAFMAAMEGAVGGQMFAYGFIGAVASATADTLSNEIGVLYKYKPRLITDLRVKVEPGTSGAVSPLGEAVVFISSLFIGVLAFSLGLSGFLVIPVTVLSAFIGNLVDSFLGATVQGIYWCNRCKKFTEKNLHSCGREAELKRGFKWINNHMVNFSMSLIAALVSISLSLYMGLC